jgi:hypothetical protein
MSLQIDVLVVSFKVGLGIRKVVIAAIDSTFQTTVSEARHLVNAFLFDD